MNGIPGEPKRRDAVPLCRKSRHERNKIRRFRLWRLENFDGYKLNEPHMLIHTYIHAQLHKQSSWIRYMHGKARPMGISLIFHQFFYEEHKSALCSTARGTILCRVKKTKFLQMGRWWCISMVIHFYSIVSINMPINANWWLKISIFRPRMVIDKLGKAIIIKCRYATDWNCATTPKRILIAITPFDHKNLNRISHYYRMRCDLSKGLNSLSPHTACIPLVQWRARILCHTREPTNHQ